MLLKETFGLLLMALLLKVYHQELYLRELTYVALGYNQAYQNLQFVWVVGAGLGFFFLLVNRLFFFKTQVQLPD